MPTDYSGPEYDSSEYCTATSDESDDEDSIMDNIQYVQPRIYTTRSGEMQPLTFSANDKEDLSLEDKFRMLGIHHEKDSGESKFGRTETFQLRQRSNDAGGVEAKVGADGKQRGFSIDPSILKKMQRGTVLSGNKDGEIRDPDEFARYNGLFKDESHIYVAGEFEEPNYAGKTMKQIEMYRTNMAFINRVKPANMQKLASDKLLEKINTHFNTNFSQAQNDRYNANRARILAMKIQLEKDREIEFQNGSSDLTEESKSNHYQSDSYVEGESRSPQEVKERLSPKLKSKSYGYEPDVQTSTHEDNGEDSDSASSTATVISHNSEKDEDIGESQQLQDQLKPVSPNDSPANDSPINRYSSMFKRYSDMFNRSPINPSPDNQSPVKVSPPPEKELSISRGGLPIRTEFNRSYEYIEPTLSRSPINPSPDIQSPVSVSPPPDKELSISRGGFPIRTEFNRSYEYIDTDAKPQPTDSTDINESLHVSSSKSIASPKLSDVSNRMQDLRLPPSPTQHDGSSSPGPDHDKKNQIKHLENGISRIKSRGKSKTPPNKFSTLPNPAVKYVDTPRPRKQSAEYSSLRKSKLNPLKVSDIQYLPIDEHYKRSSVRQDSYSVADNVGDENIIDYIPIDRKHDRKSGRKSSRLSRRTPEDLLSIKTDIPGSLNTTLNDDSIFDDSMVDSSVMDTELDTELETERETEVETTIIQDSGHKKSKSKSKTKRKSKEKKAEKHSPLAKKADDYLQNAAKKVEVGKRVSSSELKSRGTSEEFQEKLACLRKQLKDIKVGNKNHSSSYVMPPGSLKRDGSLDPVTGGRRVRSLSSSRNTTPVSTIASSKATLPKRIITDIDVSNYTKGSSATPNSTLNSTGSKTGHRKPGATSSRKSSAKESHKKDQPRSSTTSTESSNRKKSFKFNKALILGADLNTAWKQEALTGRYNYVGLSKAQEPHFKKLYGEKPIYLSLWGEEGKKKWRIGPDVNSKVCWLYTKKRSNDYGIPLHGWYQSDKGDWQRMADITIQMID